MRYIFCGNMFADIEKDLKDMKAPPAVSAHKVQVNLVRGMAENGQKITVLNNRLMRHYPLYKRILIKRTPFVIEGTEYGVNINVLNLPIIKPIVYYFSLKAELKRELRNVENENTVIMFYNNLLVRYFAVKHISRRHENILLCDIVGDLHGDYGLDFPGQHRGVKGKIVSWLEIIEDKLSRRFDAYGFATEAMADALGVKDKPHIIIEGLYSGEILKSTEDDPSQKTILYAGAVEEIYGIQHMLNAFLLIQDKNYRLEIAGSGSAVEMVRSFSQKDMRIRYLGYITPSEVEKHQQAATVLVNPRTSEHNFVKYSFPSKNMECLASGKPYIAHRLICNPDEYSEYIQYPEDESDAALAAKIIEVCNLTKEERREIGERARTFILTQKNPRTQCKKIVDMMESVE